MGGTRTRDPGIISSGDSPRKPVFLGGRAVVRHAAPGNLLIGGAKGGAKEQRS
jgi:hypothetical protein